MTEKAKRGPKRPEDLTWWHVVEIDGVKTKGVHDYSGPIGDRYLMPADLSGKTVLDIGPFDGYWSARAKKNGAADVLAVDYNKRHTAALVARAYDFEYRGGEVYDYNLPQTIFRRFDVVLFYGVVYHLYNPIQGLINAINATADGGLLLIESAVNQAGSAGLGDGFRFNFETHDGDDTNYFMPSERGLVGALKTACKVVGRSFKVEQEAFDPTHTRMTLAVRL
jgi:tRNA (mo5U34)-methyltransferase